MTTKKVAVVNRQTNIVENIVMVNNGDVLEGYDLVNIPDNYTTVDKRFIVIHNIDVGVTKWSSDNGFTDLNGNPIVSYQKVL